jgi:glyoxylase-like metal-dependent hydrolase (beta-lactamase superfamily II)
MAIVYKIRLGLSNAYLIEDKEGTVLVDTGHPNRERVFFKHLARHKIDPEQIRLIVITHVHFDHVGSLREIKRLCKCPVAIHEEEAGLLRGGRIVLPPGTNLFGKAASLLGRKLAKNWLTFDPVEPDILCSSELSLEAFGAEGKVVPTPGHTDGSLCVVLKTGEAFVGDLASNYFPFGLGPIFPPFAENVFELLKSWQLLLAAGAKHIYPAHGTPFGADRLKKELDLRSIK